MWFYTFWYNLCSYVPYTCTSCQHSRTNSWGTAQTHLCIRWLKSYPNMITWSKCDSCLYKLIIFVIFVLLRKYMARAMLCLNVCLRLVWPSSMIIPGKCINRRIALWKILLRTSMFADLCWDFESSVCFVFFHFLPWQAVISVVKVSIGRSSYPKIAEAIRMFFKKNNLFPRGLQHDTPCVVDWSVKQSLGLQKLALWLQNMSSLMCVFYISCP